jgi:DNA (cytosine-5)-methyltransferase 1
MSNLKHGSLFSGIGGFDLAASWMGWENVFHCEWNPFGQKVLKYHFPQSISYNDITKTEFTIHRGSIDILTGGFPCQPYSLAGKRKGKEDARNLWPEMLRAIREIQPGWIVGENVFGIVNWSNGLVFHEIQTDLQAEGYELFPYVLPACAVNAPHRRDRVWFIAYANSNGQQWGNGKDEINTSERREYAFSNAEQMGGDVADTDGVRRGENERIRNGKSNEHDKIGAPRTWENFPIESPICVGNDGIPNKLDGITFSKWRNESIKAAGNAIVPQVAYNIFQTIEASI